VLAGANYTRQHTNFCVSVQIVFGLVKYLFNYGIKIYQNIGYLLTNGMHLEKSKQKVILNGGSSN
jgi:hypothetical protein